MRLAIKITLWVLLLGGSAATGALIAARSNPLPPQVTEGRSPSAVPTTAPPRPVRWTGSMRSSSFHRLYVGGTCHTSWTIGLRFAVAQDGSLSGTGTARLASGDAPCSFAVAQLEIRRFALRVTGELRGGSFRLHLMELSHEPSAGAEDLGGFRKTVLSDGPASTLLVRLTDPGDAAGSAKITMRVPGPDRDVFGSTNSIRLRCRNC